MECVAGCSSLIRSHDCLLMEFVELAQRVLRLEQEMGRAGTALVLAGDLAAFNDSELEESRNAGVINQKVNRRRERRRFLQNGALLQRHLLTAPKSSAC